MMYVDTREKYMDKTMKTRNFSHPFFLTFLYLTLLSPSFSLALVSIQGTVKNQDGEPIIWATVSTDYGSQTTQSNGAYLISHEPGTFNVTASAMGYSSHTEVLDQAVDGTVDLDFILLKAPLSIDSVSPNWGKTGQPMDVTIYGSDFDEDTRVSVSIDTGNRGSLVGLVDTPGSADAVQVVGSYAYIADRSSGLQIIDVSTPSAPTLVAPEGVDTPGLAMAVQVVDNYAYVADYGTGLQVIDINPASPDYLSIIGSVDTILKAMDISIKNKIAYVADGSNGLRVVNIDPVSPDYLTVTSTVNTSNEAWGVQTAGNYAYVADYGAGLQIIDINPASSDYHTIIGSVDIPGHSVKVDIAGTVACVVDWHSGLQIIDIDPVSPGYLTIIGSVDKISDGLNVTVIDKVAYVADGTYGLRVVDVDPDSPDYLTAIGSVDTFCAKDIAVVGSMAFVADDSSGLQVVNVDSLRPFSSIPSVATPGFAHKVTVVGTVAYVAESSWSSYGGLQLIDVDPASPDYLNIIGSVDAFGSSVYSIMVVDTVAYVTGSFGLKLIDVDFASPDYLTVIGTVDTISDAHDFTIKNKVAYVIDGLYGLRVIDIDPASPYYLTETHSVSISSAVGIAVVDTVAYVIGGMGLTLVDIDSASPDYLTVINSSFTSGGDDITVVGTVAYIVDGSYGLRLIDINPASPDYLTEIAVIDTPSSAMAVAVEDNVAYLIDWSSGLQVVDVDPASPYYLTKIASISIPHGSDDVKVEDGLIYVANNEDGLIILPELIKLTINDYTSSQVQVTLPATDYASHYTIRVFNSQDQDELLGAVTFSTAKFVSKAIIVAGYGPHSSNWLWNETFLNANFAYKGLVWQGYTPANILYLSSVDIDLTGDGGSDVDDDATSANLQNAVLNWASDAENLVLYLVDHGGKGTFHIKHTDTVNDILQADTLAGWINTLQETMSGRAVVVYEGCYSGSFLDAFKVPDNKDYERILMTSSTDLEKSKLLGGGALSFSFQFWAMIHDSPDLIKAFNHGYDMMASSQTAWLDANGDGIPNDNTLDIIANPIIGRGFNSASGVLYVVNSSLPQAISDTTSADLWAELISPNPLTRVWAVVVPPDYDPNSADIASAELPSVDLTFNESSKKWEASWDEFTANGTYKISFFAKDDQDNISLPRSTTVAHSGTGSDDYEDDDISANANTIVINSQMLQFHTIHEEGDEDWIKFYGLAGESYAVKVTNPGPKMDAIIELYDSDGTTLIKWKNTIAALPGTEELLTWDGCSRDDIYYVRIYHGNHLASGIGNNYDLSFYNPDLADFPPFVSMSGAISIDGGGALSSASLTVIRTNLDESFQTTAITDSLGNYSFELPPGDYNVIVDADGYQTKSLSLTVETENNEPLNLAIAPDFIPPVANAGNNLVVNNCDSVILNGLGSTDNGTIESWEWILHHQDDPNDSQDIYISGPNQQEATVSNLRIGIYTVTLIVTDDESAIDATTIELSVSEAWGDVNGDCQVGLEEAINALQTTTGQ